MTLPFSERVSTASLVSACARRAASSNDVGLVERGDLRLVGEQDVDAGADQLQELGAVPVDAERIGEAERHLPPGLGRDLGRLAERRLGLGPVEQVALEIDDARGADQLGIDLAAAELRADAQEGVHGALAVGRHQDQAAPGRLAALRGRGRLEGHAGGADVVPEDLRRTGRRAVLPMKPARPPNEATPTMVLATEPPEISMAGPMSS